MSDSSNLKSALKDLQKKLNENLTLFGNKRSHTYKKNGKNVEVTLIGQDRGHKFEYNINDIKCTIDFNKHEIKIIEESDCIEKIMEYLSTTNNNEPKYSYDDLIKFYNNEIESYDKEQEKIQEQEEQEEQIKIKVDELKSELTKKIKELFNEEKTIEFDNKNYSISINTKKIDNPYFMIKNNNKGKELKYSDINSYSIIGDYGKDLRTFVEGGNRKSRRNRKSKKGKRSRKARKSRRKSNRRRGRR